MRREFTKAVKLEAWKRSGGRCESCGAWLCPGKYRYDHINPDTFGGEPTLENCQVICYACDAEKTYDNDIPAIAKNNRIRNKHIGITKRKSRPIPGTKASGIRKRMSGKIERW